MSKTSWTVALGACGLLVGCAGQAPPQRAAHDAWQVGTPAAVSSGAQAPAQKGDYCTTIVRGKNGEAHDTRIAERWPDRSYGDEEVAFTGMIGSRSRVMLVGFELGSIPEGASVTWAALSVRATTCATCSTQSLTAHRITAPWDERSSTWSSFGGAYAGDAEAGAKLVEGKAAELEFEITSLVRDWLSHARSNHGVALVQASGTTSFATSESASAAARPRLAVCYDMPAGDHSARSDAKDTP